jgi:hypothetical protein
MRISNKLLALARALAFLCDLRATFAPFAGNAFAVTSLTSQTSLLSPLQNPSLNHCIQTTYNRQK